MGIWYAFRSFTYKKFKIFDHKKAIGSFISFWDAFDFQSQNVKQAPEFSISFRSFESWSGLFGISATGFRYRLNVVITDFRDPRTEPGPTTEQGLRKIVAVRGSLTDFGSGSSSLKFKSLDGFYFRLGWIPWIFDSEVQICPFWVRNHN